MWIHTFIISVEAMLTKKYHMIFYTYKLRLI